MCCVYADHSLQSPLTSWCMSWILPLPRTMRVEDLAKNSWTFGQSSRRLSTRVCIRKIPSGTGAEVGEQSQNKSLSIAYSDHYSLNVLRVEFQRCKKGIAVPYCRFLISWAAQSSSFEAWSSGVTSAYPPPWLLWMME